MLPFLIYEGKAAVALAVFYMFYRLLLRKETFHRFNRVVLVGTAVLSFLLPLCIITIHRPMEMAPAGYGAAPSLEDGSLLELNLTAGTQVAESTPWWQTALVVLFWAGAAFVLLRAAVSILSLFRIIRQGTLVREEDGCKIILTGRDIDPFSWMKYIVLSRKDWEGPNGPIISHEKAHIGYGHSAEVLLVDVLSAFQWFNPAIWMLRADLKELHEYEADDAVLRSGANLKEYQYLLIRKAVGKSGYSVANSFNHSILKNRITMMSKSKSPLSRGLRALYLLPLVCLSIGLQAKTVYVPSDKDSEKNVSDEKNKALLQEVVVVKYADASVNPEDIRHGDGLETLQIKDVIDADTMPQCSENFALWLNSRIYYPQDCLQDGTILVSFVVDDNGNVGAVRIEHGICEELDNIVVKQIAKSPSWTPATKDGKKVAVKLFQPFEFQIRTRKQAPEAIVLDIKADGKIESGGKVYTTAQLKDLIKPHEEGKPLTTVQVVVTDDVPMGVIVDIKQELRKLGALKAQYASPSENGGTTRYMPQFPAASTSSKVKRENLFIVRINSADRVLFGDKLRQNDGEMLQAGKDFLRKHGKDALFSLIADRGTSYGAYRHMRELLMRIYADVRAEKAMEQYGKSLSELSMEEVNQIYKQFPLSIKEAEPK